MKLSRFFYWVFTVFVGWVALYFRDKRSQYDELSEGIGSGLLGWILMLLFVGLVIGGIVPKNKKNNQ